MKDKIYFVGIGGIGMSALARFFLAEGYKVAGYDRTPSDITESISSNGGQISYLDSVESIPEEFKNVAETYVVYTPAVPADSAILSYFLDGGFEIVKRSVALGRLSEGKYLMAVAGSHGKSTTSTLAAYINYVSLNKECSAFLGAISKNFDSNLVIGGGKRLVVEADEFDRSFLQLKPDAAVITAVDPDHLDIYHSASEYSEGFAQFIECIKPSGKLVVKKGINVEIRNKDIEVFSYSLHDTSADYHAVNVRTDAEGFYTYDIVTPFRVIHDCRLGVRGIVNVENSIAAVSLVDLSLINDEKLKEALSTFMGIKRRFEVHVSGKKIIYMDDYAHHPGELSAMISSVRNMFPGRSVTIAFQPHLYTRTRDFAKDFSSALSKADRVLLLPIYPARELPIEGVCSEMLMKNITVPCEIVKYEDLLDKVSSLRNELQVFVTAGAGNIDRLVPKIKEMLDE